MTKIIKNTQKTHLHTRFTLLLSTRCLKETTERAREKLNNKEERRNKRKQKYYENITSTETQLFR